MTRGKLHLLILGLNKKMAGIPYIHKENTNIFILIPRDLAYDPILEIAKPRDTRPYTQYNPAYLRILGHEGSWWITYSSFPDTDDTPRDMKVYFGTEMQVRIKTPSNHVTRRALFTSTPPMQLKPCESCLGKGTKTYTYDEEELYFESNCQYCRGTGFIESKPTGPSKYTFVDVDAFNSLKPTQEQSERFMKRVEKEYKQRAIKNRTRQQNAYLQESNVDKHQRR